MTSVCVATPSRGLVHSRTVEGVMRNIRQADARGHTVTGWVLTHDKPIPDCHESVFADALATGCDAVWCVEEDNVPPDGSLCASIALLRVPDRAIVAVDYPVGHGTTWGVIPRHPDSGVIPWCGLGTTLVAREVLDRVARPWFDTSTQWAVQRSGTRVDIIEAGGPYTYGGQDINFGIRATAAGFGIAEVPGMTGGHCIVRGLGAAEVNSGAHAVEVRTQIERAPW